MANAFRYEKRNFRDLGGWSTSTGTVKKGQLYRCGHLDRLSYDEIAMIKRLGIGNVVDLRNDVEKANAPMRVAALVPGLIDYDINLSDAVDAESLPGIVDELAKMKHASQARDWMCAQYVDAAQKRRTEIQRVLEFIMQCDRPTAFFCVAGKDRTGIVAAMLLSVLGVARTDIQRDYERTNKRLFGIPFFRRKDRTARAQYNLVNVRKNVIDALADACPAYLAAFFTAIDTCGGITGYLDGLDFVLLDDFRRRMIV